MLDCIKNLGRRNTKHQKPKNTPWNNFIPNMFTSNHDPSDGYDGETHRIIAINKVKGIGHGHFPKGKLK